MPDEAWIVIKNWDRYAPKRRNKNAVMPWIRLYRKLLTHYEYRQLEPQYRAILVDLWLLASEDDGRVHAHIGKLAFKIGAVGREDWLMSGLQAIAALGFIELPPPLVNKLHTSRTQVVDELYAQGKRSEEKGTEGKREEIPRSPKRARVGAKAGDPGTLHAETGGFTLDLYLDLHRSVLGALPTNPGHLGMLLKPLDNDGVDRELTLARWTNFLGGLKARPAYAGTEASRYRKFASAPALYDDPEWYLSEREKAEGERLTDGLYG